MAKQVGYKVNSTVKSVKGIVAKGHKVEDRLELSARKWLCYRVDLVT